MPCSVMRAISATELLKHAKQVSAATLSRSKYPMPARFVHDLAAATMELKACDKMHSRFGWGGESEDFPHLTSSFATSLRVHGQI